MKRFPTPLFGLFTLTLAVTALQAESKGASAVPGVLNFKTKSLAGTDVDLSSLQGKVVLFVNVASKCGYTPQYKPLEALHEKYSDKGLAIVGVPANDFGKQEPGSDADIASFCSVNYGVKFLILSKVPAVNGPDAAPLYRFLTSKETNPKFGGDIQWNFTKFLVSRSGEIVNRFESGVAPDSTEMITAIESELAKK